MKSKPLIRWTIGKTSDSGLHCLNTSVKYMKQLYDKNFRYVVCYNNLSNNQKKSLPNIEQIDQEKHVDALPCKPLGPAWKLYPPRLEFDNHEIIIDNDVVIYNKLPQLERFLQRKDLLVITEAIKRSYSGVLQQSIPNDFNINSGLLCLPPNFDFKQKILDALLGWNDHFSEQTLVGYIMCQQPSVEIIPLSDVFVCYNEYKRGSCGIHFVGLNSNIDVYWKKYIRCGFL